MAVYRLLSKIGLPHDYDFWRQGQDAYNGYEESWRRVSEKKNLLIKKKKKNNPPKAGPFGPSLRRMLGPAAKANTNGTKFNLKNLKKKISKKKFRKKNFEKFFFGQTNTHTDTQTDRQTNALKYTINSEIGNFQIAISRSDP